MKADRPIKSVVEMTTISQENIAGCLVPQVVPERLSETITSWNRFLSGSVYFLASPIFCFSLIKTYPKGLWLFCTSPLLEASAGASISLGLVGSDLHTGDVFLQLWWVQWDPQGSLALDPLEAESIWDDRNQGHSSNNWCFTPVDWQESLRKLWPESRQVAEAWEASGLSGSGTSRKLCSVQSVYHWLKW